jgi:GTP-binding protein HflX
LAESAGYVVVSEFEQTRKPDARYQIGAGKVEELAALVKETGADRLVFDNPLKTRQLYNLAKATGVEPIDRFKLILEIFARRATTTEAQLQIQLAEQQYELTHAKERIRLSKMREQPGFMGLGSYEADVYYDAVKRQLQTTRKKLAKIGEKRVLHRERRVELGFCSISLAGYTNAGKSSLFNALTEATTEVDNALFTTLSTTTRLVEFSGRKFLLTDTVGFIERLPFRLIDAFHSTLEETISSDLIVLVVDINEPLEKIRKKNQVCLETIDRIGASGVPIITVLNKIDRISDSEASEKLEQLKEEIRNPVMVSAIKRTNLDLLRKEILGNFEKYVQASFSVPITDRTMQFISAVYKGANVKEAKYSNDSVRIAFESDPSFIEKIRKQIEGFGGHFEKIGK